MVSVAWETATQLIEEGIDVGVINARFLKPLDSETILDQAQVSGRLLTIEENVLRGGYGESVRQAIAEAGLANKIEHQALGLPDAFVEHGTQPILRHEVGLCAERLTQVVRQMLQSTTVRKR